MTNLDRRPIGMFDSGYGGLTVLAQVRQQLPGEHVIYFGDNARAPYGPRAGDEIVEFNKQIVEYMLTQQVKAVIMACNTSTSYAIQSNRQLFPVPFISLIEQGLDTLPSQTTSGKVAVIATQGTVAAGAFGKAINTRFPHFEVSEIACPLFVPIIESGRVMEAQTQVVARGYLEQAFEEGVDCVILGCTHYPFLLPVLRRIAPPHVRFIDPAEGAVAYTARFLADSGLRGAGTGGRYTYYTSGDPDKFRIQGEDYLGFPLEQVSSLVF